MSCLRNLVYSGAPMRESAFNLNTCPGGKLDFDYVTRIYKVGGNYTHPPAAYRTHYHSLQSP